LRNRGRQKTDDSIQKSEDRRQKTVGRREKAGEESKVRKTGKGKHKE
jgi:hypothetical protein